MNKKTISLLVLGPLFALMSGCAAVGTAVSHGNLQTQTLMSKSVFLNPVPNNQKTVYIQVHNTTDKPSFSIKEGLADALADKGYRVVYNYSRAHYVLQVNLLQVGKTSKTAAKEMFGKGYGGTAEGAVVGSLLAADTGHDMLAGGIVGGVATTIINNAVKDVTFSGIVDVRITEKMPSGHIKAYKTRIMSTANKVNLSFADAERPLEVGLVNSISGIF